MNTSRAGKTELEYRSLLGCFLFSGDDVEKKIKVLSGGEKARVALAKTIVSKANFLMLDEPTNHLDMHSVELLVEALNRYEGSIILVSHDRYFISKVANVFWEIIDHKIREFRGTYDEYVMWKEKLEAEAKAKVQEKVEVKGEAKVQEKVEVKGELKDEGKAGKGKAINKELQKELQKQQRLFEKLEADIDKQKLELKNLEALLADSGTYGDRVKFAEVEAAYGKSQQKINELQWQSEQAFEKLMELEEALAVG
jgi:ATP-binding cassette, subfamily F, member 3